MALFPPKFSPDLLMGARALQHAEREDRFQQLVGDGLRNSFGAANTHVSTTRSKDGSIDVWVEGGERVPLFDSLPTPIIVECKDHLEDDVKDLEANVLSGWYTVKEVLDRAAKKGWTELHRPWKEAHSYVYAVSCRLTVELKKKLKDKIQSFFDGLVTDERPPIEQIRVLDWGDLCSWLNGLPRVRDDWLGTGLESVISHADYVQGLTGFQAYLLEEHLPFVPPGLEKEFHPERLWETLQQLAGKQGVLLVGKGGVGKTRTLLEVSQRASDAEWRVLHVRALEPGVTVQKLAKIVLSGKDPTLLTFDYLERMPHLDLGAIRRALLPEAANKGIPLALLADTRPSLRSRDATDNPERNSLFQVIPLEPDEAQSRELRERLIEKVAPMAHASLGAERMAELCGERPIIALFIARELERLAGNGKLERENLALPRPHDLMGWLQRRLREDGLWHAPGGGLLPNVPIPELQAAAAVLASAPALPEELSSAAASTLTQAGSTQASMANYLVERLEAWGWLNRGNGPFWHTCHDVVTDTVLEQLLRLDGSVRKELLSSLLVGVHGEARLLGRMATALNRLLLAHPPEEDAFGRSLAEASGKWLEQHAAEIGEKLPGRDRDLVSYALGALLSGPPWAETVINHWEVLIDPWMARHAEAPEARHLLYKGLKELSPPHRFRLAPPARRWLARHGATPEASFLLKLLLDEKVIPSDAQTREDIQTALAWLNKYSLILEAGFVLDPLLGRTDLAERAPEAIDYAFDWLGKEEHSLILEAGFVLKPLLGRTDLAERAPEAIDYAFDWLGKEEHSLILEAGFVLYPLLGRTDLAERAREAIDYAFDWLGEHSLILEARFVLDPLLERTDLALRARKAIDYAFDWLGEHSLILEAGFVLDPLLGRTDLAERAREAIDYAFDWLGEHSLILEAGFVLDPLLERTDLALRARKAIDYAFDWLGKHSHTVDAGFVLKNLLTRNEVSDSQQERGVEIALLRLENTSSFPEDTTFLLRYCLDARLLSEKTEKRVITVAFHWLQQHGQHDDADFVYKRLLRRVPPLVDALWVRFARSAIRWLTIHSRVKERDFLLNSLLRRPALLQPNELTAIAKDALHWVEQPPAEIEAKEQLLRKLNRAVSDPQLLERIHQQGKALGLDISPSTRSDG
ncbi:MAG: hypothetical protein HQL51_08270 [Magnetococcales bacterium]|nr:hypothetical protein [Magnetococcales bacterium]